MTATLFRASEILDMALQIEQLGIAFYTACRERTDVPGLEDVFSWLIEQENLHVDIFSGMKEDLDDFRLPESFRGEYESHLAAYVEGKVFSGPEQAEREARRLPDGHAVIDWAVTFEGKSIAFYRMIKDHVRGSEGDTIAGVIREEQRHIDRLNGLRRKLDDGSSGADAR
jgi:rubrerythrin